MRNEREGRGDRRPMRQNRYSDDEDDWLLKI